MEKTNYQIGTTVGENAFLHYCAMTNSFILLSKENHILYENSSPEELEFKNKKLYDYLADVGFLIESSIDEKEIITNQRDLMRTDKSEYHVVINTTLDCNLKCWYCYESKVVGSRLTAEVISMIKDNITARYKKYPFQSLKISFFGGEPFMDFHGMKEVLDFAKEFCERNEIILYADFTTNATLINKEIVEYLSPFACSFQITLDGDKNRHNKIKYWEGKSIDTYGRVLESLRLIDSNIETDTYQSV